MTTLTSALIDRVNLETDIRYQLTWNYGGVMLEIPRRLGHSAALDAASDALVTAHARFCRGMLQSDESAIVKHGRALKALRNDLNDSSKAQSTETLAAIWLIMINQVCMIVHSRHRNVVSDQPFRHL